MHALSPRQPHFFTMMVAEALSAVEAGALIRARRLTLHLTQEQVVERTGLSSQSYLSSFEKGRYHIGRSEHFPALARVLSLTDDQIKSINPLAVFEQPSGKPSDGSSVGVVGLNYTMKNLYSLAQASRPVSELEPIPDLSPIPVPNADLRSGTELFQVVGHSMTVRGDGGIMQGDVAYVDTHDLSPAAGGVFVIHIPGDGVTIKRVQRLSGDFYLFSDNEDQTTYPPFRVDEARVIGRVHNVTRRVLVRL
jgi:repressor LexA